MSRPSANEWSLCTRNLTRPRDSVTQQTLACPCTILLVVHLESQQHRAPSSHFIALSLCVWTDHKIDGCMCCSKSFVLKEKILESSSRGHRNHSIIYTVSARNSLVRSKNIALSKPSSAFPTHDLPRWVSSCILDTQQTCVSFIVS